jgi:hypothetical protein
MTLKLSLFLISISSFASLISIMYQTPQPFVGGDTDEWDRQAGDICPALCSRVDKRFMWSGETNCQSQEMFDATGIVHRRALKCFCDCIDGRVSSFSPLGNPQLWAAQAARQCPEICASLSQLFGKKIRWGKDYTCGIKRKLEQTGRYAETAPVCECGCIDY